MEQAELENLVAELETRVDRLRALYDQYFMGIEKLEPQVPRKDVDRRIHVLRKEQLRNTGLRYRFQMILQRYNTYQTFWARIIRQIEGGTYKRHVLRAEARFGDVLSQGASKARRRSTAPPEMADAKPPNAATPASAANAANAIGLAAEIDDPFADFALPPLPSLTSPPSPGAKRPVGGSLDADFGLLDDPLSRPPSSMSIPAIRPHEIAAFAAAAAAAPAPPAPPSAPSLAGAARPLWRKAGAPAAPVPPSPTADLPARRVPPPAPAAPPPPPPVAARVAPAAPPAPVHQPARPPAAPPAPTDTGAKPPVPRPSPPRPSPPRPASPTEKSSQPERSEGTSDPRGLPDERVRQLYAQYVEEKRKRNESTAAITFDGLARSLRDSSAKLREKHGRPVDFEVSVKDGKTVIKPVVK